MDSDPNLNLPVFGIAPGPNGIDDDLHVWTNNFGLRLAGQRGTATPAVACVMHLHGVGRLQKE